MRIFVYSILMVVGLSLLGACNPQPEASSLLEEAGYLVEKHPDSAMLLIDSIFYPEKSLNHEYYMRFLVTQVQAKYKAYRPIHEDTLIFRARDYFSGRGKDPRTTALAYCLPAVSCNSSSRSLPKPFKIPAPFTFPAKIELRYTTFIKWVVQKPKIRY